MALVAEKPVEKDVFAPTPEIILGETCEKCGPAVPARYHAEKNKMSLFFCGHHIRAYNEGLKEKGFTIYPEDISYNAGSPKV